MEPKVRRSSAKNGGPISFPVTEVIAGWTEGLQLMPVGSKVTRSGSRPTLLTTQL